MKAYSILPLAFVALTSCGGGSQQNNEATANCGNASTVEAGGLDMAKVKTIWQARVKEMNPEDEGTKFNKKALYDIDGDGCDEVIFSEQTQGDWHGFVGVFSVKGGLELVDFSNCGWQTTFLEIFPKGFVCTSGGSESGMAGWCKYSKLVNSKVAEIYYNESESDETESGDIVERNEYKMQKNGQAEQSISKEEYEKAVPQNVERIDLSSLKWEDVEF